LHTERRRMSWRRRSGSLTGGRGKVGARETRRRRRERRRRSRIFRER
jgi:hypothetical protein